MPVSCVDVLDVGPRSLPVMRSDVDCWEFWDDRTVRAHSSSASSWPPPSTVAPLGLSTNIRPLRGLLSCILLSKLSVFPIRGKDSNCDGEGICTDGRRLTECRLFSSESPRRSAAKRGNTAGLGATNSVLEVLPSETIVVMSDVSLDAATTVLPDAGLSTGRSGCSNHG